MDISKYDSTLDNAMFFTKIENIFVMLYSSIMKRNLDTVKHKVSDEIIYKYQEYVDELKSNHEIQMYGELNVKSADITSIEEDDKFIIVKVDLISRFLNYVIDETSLNIKRGSNQGNREEHMNHLTFMKRKDAKKMPIARHCPSCGSMMDVSNNGKCSYCGEIFNTEDFDYILVKIETI